MSAALHDPPIPDTFVDMDAVAWSFPASSDDRFQQRLALRNLEAVWRNCQAVGVTHLILARVLESRDELEEYQLAIPGAAIQVVRLRASVATLHERIKHGRTEWDPLMAHGPSGGAGAAGGRRKY